MDCSRCCNMHRIEDIIEILATCADKLELLADYTSIRKIDPVTWEIEAITITGTCTLTIKFCCKDRYAIFNDTYLFKRASADTNSWICEGNIKV